MAWSKKLNQFTWINPDVINRVGAYTFVYDLKNKKLHTEKYPVTHEDMMNNNDYHLAKEMGWEPKKGWFNLRKNTGLTREKALPLAILGRVGKYDGRTAIGIWNPTIDKNVLQHCLKELVVQVPHITKNPQRVVVFFDFNTSGIPPTTLSDIIPDLQSIDSTTQPQEESPECDKLATLTVDGKPMTLSTMIGNMHMVRGASMDAMKGAFCPAATALKQKVTTAGCKGTAEVIDTLWGKMGCASGQSDQYNQLKQLGANAYRRDLRKVFDNPNSVDTEFRGRQKDIDAAWDYLQKKEHSFQGFKTWLEATLGE